MLRFVWRGGYGLWMQIGDFWLFLVVFGVLQLGVLLCPKIREGFGIGEIMRARGVIKLLCRKVAGVAEWLGSGLQLKSVCRNPLMLVRIRPPAPDYFLVGSLVWCWHEVIRRW